MERKAGEEELVLDNRATGAKALKKFMDFGDDYNPIAIARPSAGKHVDTSRAIANYRGYLFGETGSHEILRRCRITIQ
jgi:hypothetical protein